MHSKRAIRDAEKYQANYFGYKPLGIICFFLTKKALQKYMMSRFFEQSEKNQEAFARLAHKQHRQRQRFLKKAMEK